MSLPDTNYILREYLLDQSAITDLVSTRIYCPRAPENAELPNITFFTRGGVSTPYIPDYASPSVQIDCWADDSIEAREIYRALYDSLQGIQDESITVGGTDYLIASAIEEVVGQDLVDTDIPGRFRVLSFWEIIVK